MSIKSYDEIITDFEEITNHYNRSDQYFDILYDSISSTVIAKTPSAENFSVNANKSGIVARSFIGSWKEVAVEASGDLNVVKTKIPKESKKGDLIAEFDRWNLNKEIKAKIDPLNVPIDEKIEKVREIYKYIKNADERIINVQVKYLELLIERIFVNNEGCKLRQVIPRTRVFVVPIAKEGSVVEYDYFVKSGEMGFEIFESLENRVLDQVVNNSLEMLKSELPPAGRNTIILDPQMAGLIAHESFGHGLEADQVLRGRSYLKHHLHKQVASELCTIYDTPSLEMKLGSYFFDDEGIKAGHNILVENGILKNFIYDRRSATELKATPQGNGRRESFAHPVNVRMSNTYFGSGDYELEEMVSEIKEGVMLVHGYFGMEDPLGGGMQCTSKKGYLIENGEKTKILKATALSGDVLEMLKNIDAVSKDTLKLDGGTCGKGSEDMVPVTSGGSYIRAKNALVSPG
ncbi:MAG: TldD/PmbA family protein [Candidatus Lokiarchaeota archaeon]|nr:TldD/PmbA family protein [Candidatus Lokiarchaeota archaeon]